MYLSFSYKNYCGNQIFNIINSAQLSPNQVKRNFELVCNTVINERISLFFAVACLASQLSQCPRSTMRTVTPRQYQLVSSVVKVSHVVISLRIKTEQDQDRTKMSIIHSYFDCNNISTVYVYICRYIILYRLNNKN